MQRYSPETARATTPTAPSPAPSSSPLPLRTYRAPRLTKQPNPKAIRSCLKRRFQPFSRTWYAMGAGAHRSPWASASETPRPSQQKSPLGSPRLTAGDWFTWAVFAWTAAVILFNLIRFLGGRS